MEFSRVGFVVSRMLVCRGGSGVERGGGLYGRPACPCASCLLPRGLIETPTRTKPLPCPYRKGSGRCPLLPVWSSTCIMALGGRAGPGIALIILESYIVSSPAGVERSFLRKPEMR